jgi:hypothetical protein
MEIFLKIYLGIRYRQDGCELYCSLTRFLSPTLIYLVGEEILSYLTLLMEKINFYLCKYNY